MAKKRSHYRQPREKLRRATEVLRDTEALQLKLEDGSVETFSMAEELEIPTDLEDLAHAAREAPAQLAFWGYQTERMLVRLRKAEGMLDEKEAKSYLIYRAFYEKEQCTDPTEAMIQARLSQDATIRTFRIALRSRKKEYGAVRAMRDAVNHRVSMVRMLIGKYEPV